MNSKIFKYVLLILFLMFIGLYFSSNAGLIDYQAKYKKTLTEEQIRQFEEDLKNDVNVDIKDYINTNNKEYSNTVSKTTLKISNMIGKTVKGTLDFMLKQLEKSMSK